MYSISTTWSKYCYEKLLQIQDLNAFYLKITWIYRHSHKRNKRINYAIASVLLAGVKVMTGGITLNSIVFGTLTTAGILLKSYHEFKNINSKTDLLKFSLTWYEKVLTNLREAVRGGFWLQKIYSWYESSWSRNSGFIAAFL